MGLVWSPVRSSLVGVSSTAAKKPCSIHDGMTIEHHGTERLIVRRDIYNMLLSEDYVEQDPIFIKAALLLEQVFLEDKPKRCSLSSWLCWSLWVPRLHPFKQVSYLSSGWHKGLRSVQGPAPSTSYSQSHSPPSLLQPLSRICWPVLCTLQIRRELSYPHVISADNWATHWAPICWMIPSGIPGSPSQSYPQFLMGAASLRPECVWGTFSMKNTYVCVRTHTFNLGQSTLKQKHKHTYKCFVFYMQQAHNRYIVLPLGLS